MAVEQHKMWSGHFIQGTQFSSTVTPLGTLLPILVHIQQLFPTRRLTLQAVLNAFGIFNFPFIDVWNKGMYAKWEEKQQQKQVFYIKLSFESHK